MLIPFPLPLSACHICQAAPVGQCLRCGRFYCRQHGHRFCAACRQAAADRRPWGVALLVRLLQAAATLFLSLALLAGLASCYSLWHGAPEPATSVLRLAGIILLLLAAVAWPFHLVGTALRRGSARARLLLLVAAFPALLFAPVGTVFGLLTIRILFDPDVMIWFDIRNTPAVA